MGRKRSLLVLGWGINDIDFSTSGSGVLQENNTKYYRDWYSMIYRTNSPEYKKQNPTYEFCTIDPDWKYLSNYVKWVDFQPNRDWINCSLDKDLLISGNKHYSQSTVVYIDKSLNSFLINCTKSRGDLLLGVSLCSGSKSKPYKAECRNPFTRSGEYLGLFSDELEAHKAWQAKKHEHACIFAEQQTDQRVAKALRERYAPDKDWTNV